MHTTNIAYKQFIGYIIGDDEKRKRHSNVVGRREAHACRGM